ncbi:DUF4249 family protein [bacterium]|nr:DUF4249 family protein [bacterium]
MKIPIIALLFAFINSCTDQPDVSGSFSFIGVHGVLTPKLKNQELYLSRAVNLDQFDEYAPDTISTKLSGANVTIEYNDQTVIFTEISPGYYVDTAGVLQVIPGQTYTLEVHSAANERLTAVTTVPGVPELLLNSLIDTLRVNIDIDTLSCGTGCTMINTSINRLPLLFEWTRTQSAGSFFFQMRKDTANIFDHKYGNVTWTNFGILASRSYILDPAITLFESGEFYTDDYTWWGYPVNGDNVVEMDIEIQIKSFDKSLTDWVLKVGSNISGGYGFFGSMSYYKRPLYVIQTSKIVN